MTESRSELRRQAIQAGEPMPEFGPHDRTGEADHPSVSPVPESAPGTNPPVPNGAASGQLEPSPPARISPAALAADPELGGQGNPSRSVGREGTAPGPGMPGAAQSPEGGASEHAPASPSGSTAGQAGRAKWQKAESAHKAAKRNGRGRYPVKRRGDGYGPGMTRKMPPGSGGAA